MPTPSKVSLDPDNPFESHCPVCKGIAGDEECEECYGKGKIDYSGEFGIDSTVER